MFETIKNVGVTATVTGALFSGGWWLVPPHAEEVIDQTVKQRGYALQEQVDDANKALADQEKSIQENNRIAVETRNQVILLENKLTEILEAVKAQ